MKCPFAEQKPITANFGGPIGAIYGLVVHVQEGNNSLQGYFSNPATQASSHFWISKDGILEQYVDTVDKAWAQAAGNENYLSVECEGFDYEPMTVAQLYMLANLFEWVSNTYMIPLQLVQHGSKGFTTHAFYPSGIPDPTWGGHPCPGTIRSGQLPSVIEHLHQPTEDNEVKFIFGTPNMPTWIQSGNLVWQASEISGYAAAGFVSIPISPHDNNQLAAIAKAQGTVG